MFVKKEGAIMRYKVILKNNEGSMLMRKVNNRETARRYVKTLTTSDVKVIIKDTKYND